MSKKKMAVRSDVPYAVRLQMQKYAEIKQHRDEAARIALQLACIALNDTEGLGIVRISRFAKKLHALIDEYYEDTEVGEVHVQQRLRSMGFVMENGRMFALEDQDGNIVRADRLPPKVQSDEKED